MKTFTESSVHQLSSNHFWFECSMVGTCSPIFDSCGDNYDVEDVLRKAGIIKTTNRTDTESSALVVNFSSKKAGMKFVERLNTYLASKGK